MVGKVVTAVTGPASASRVTGIKVESRPRLDCTALQEYQGLGEFLSRELWSVSAELIGMDPGSL